MRQEALRHGSATTAKWGRGGAAACTALPQSPHSQAIHVPTPASPRGGGSSSPIQQDLMWPLAHFFCLLAAAMEQEAERFTGAAAISKADKTKRKETKTSEKSSNNHIMGAQNKKNAIHQLYQKRSSSITSSSVLKSSEMMLHTGHPLQSSLLYLLLLFAASRGMRLPLETDIDWQGCKTASQEILKHLQKLKVTKVEKPLNISLPRRIECNDHCDPDSLGKNSTLCLMKIRWGLHRYQELLTQYAKSDTTTGLRTAMTNLLQLLRKDESSSPAKPIQEWEKSHVVDVILQRLQLFAILMARVFSHCAALNRM
ncbi:interleukin-23 subunit alpha [Pantherophis guttatus]|uniref:Interleukin-23 subunit alpha n=1 Tax=Pantherophis guttatus TaxID=94885 RepID=A0A6P9BFU5_PANGU|nr:interleukin-23 subunit alpha [Pantherophis guttatus]